MMEVVHPHLIGTGFECYKFPEPKNFVILPDDRPYLCQHIGDGKVVRYLLTIDCDVGEKIHQGAFIEAYTIVEVGEVRTIIKGTTTMVFKKVEGIGIWERIA